MSVNLYRMASLAAMAALGIPGMAREIERSGPQPIPQRTREHFESERPISKRRKRRLRGKARKVQP